MIESIFCDSVVLSVVVSHTGRLTSFPEAQHTLQRFSGRPQTKDSVYVYFYLSFLHKKAFAKHRIIYIRR